MNTQTRRPESQRVRQLANEYEGKGFEVVYPRTQKDLPPFLRNLSYLPDLIATSADENLVIEVKTSETVRHDSTLVQIPDLVNEQPGWKFLFVLTKGKLDPSEKPHFTGARWHDLLAKSRHPSLTTPELAEAALVLAWAALEGALREALGSEESAKQPRVKAPMSLVRDGVIHGLIDRRELRELERLFRLRSDLVHAVEATRPSVNDVRVLQRLVEDIARGLARDNV